MPISGGKTDGMPSWSDFMKEVEKDAPEPVRLAPAPALAGTDSLS